MNKSIVEINRRMEAETSKAFPERKLVYGDGSENASIMLIGEAPGGDEEKQGRPFVGKAGKNLMEFLDRLNIKREQVYITNVVKIRPFKLSEKTGKPVNRPPDRNEIEFFSQFLYDEIEFLQPEIIVTLGNVPLQVVLKDKKASIGEYHGKSICFGESIVFPLYHPAAVIYNRMLKDVYYKDIDLLKQLTNRGIR